MSGAIIGIDPGLDGAIAYLEPDGMRVTVLPMPTVTEGVGKSVRRRVDLWRLAEILGRMRDEGAVAAWVEKVQSQPNDGHVQAFAFGWGAGVVSMGLACVRLRTFYVSPITWKRSFKLGKDKDLSRLRASQLFPDDAHFWPNKGDHDRAEAALIARYGRSVMVTAGDLAGAKAASPATA
jgi:crossover junction endodeoxyribonuclease RuvC